MPVTLVIEDVPDEVYHHLVAAAKANHRSVSDEAIARLVPRRTVEESFESVRKLRERLPGSGISSEEIVQSIRNDRDSR